MTMGLQDKTQINSGNIPTIKGQEGGKPSNPNKPVGLRPETEEKQHIPSAAELQQQVAMLQLLAQLKAQEEAGNGQEDNVENSGAPNSFSGNGSAGTFSGQAGNADSTNVIPASSQKNAKSESGADDLLSALFKQEQKAQSKEKTQDLEKLRRVNRDELRFAEELRRAQQQALIRQYLEEMSYSLKQYATDYVSAYDVVSDVSFNMPTQIIPDANSYNISVMNPTRADSFALQRLAVNSGGNLEYRDHGSRGGVLTISHELLSSGRLPETMTMSSFAGRDKCLSSVHSKAGDLHGVAIPKGGWANKIQAERVAVPSRPAQPMLS